MSHRSDCPTREEARRQGARAGYEGVGRNPYTRWGRQPCLEAETAWTRGREAGEQRREDEARERHEQQSAQERAYQERWGWE